MKIIVTGGAGFIGSHLVSRLTSSNHEIIVLDNLSSGRKRNLVGQFKKIKFCKVDISKKGKWQKLFKNVNCVFHLAALADIVPSIDNPKKYFDSNVVGTFNILEACRDHGIKKIIYSASSSCYGLTKKYPTSERDIIDPKYPYALTKRLGEEMIIHWSNLYKIKFISLRLFNVYGTKSRTSGAYGAMFGVFLTQKFFNKPLTIVGDGKQSRDFIFVTDVVSAFVKSMNIKLQNQIFNVGNGKSITINTVASILGGKKIHIPKRPGEPDKTMANIKKIKTQMKWKPQIDINEGIKLLMKDINYWKKAPIWTPQKIKAATKNWFKYL